MKSPVIISHLAGGLGNQMFQFAAGYAMAKRCGVPLLLDSSDLLARPSQANYTFRDFELNTFRLEPVIADSATRTRLQLAFPGIMGKAWRKLAGDPKTVYRETSKQFQSSFESLQAPMYLLGYWQNEKYFAAYRSDLLDLFSPRQQASNTNAQLMFQASVDCSVGVHVRRGDYLSNAHAQSFHGACSIEYYQHAIEEIQRKTGAKMFVVFSDDIPWVKENLSIPHEVIYVDHNKGKDAFWDIQIMRTCAHHIIANSSFSWWGAWLCDRPGQIVIAPNEWFKGLSPDSYEVVPERWLKR